MRYRNLGNSGLIVSEIALGGWLNLGGWVNDQTSIALIHHAFAGGVNLFDVADMYADGQCEVVLGKALKELPREQVIIATKCRARMWPGPMGEGLSRKHIIEACDASLKRLGVDYIDLYQAHSPDPTTPVEETMDAFDHLVRQGKVLYIGCSNFSGEELAAAQEAVSTRQGTGFISSQPKYNLLSRTVEKNLFPVCREHGVGNIVYSPLAHGVLTGKYGIDSLPEGSRMTRWPQQSEYLTEENLAAVEQLKNMAVKLGVTPAQLALKWVLSRPEVSAAIIGASSHKQVDENLATSDLDIATEYVGELESLFPPKSTNPKKP